MARHLFRALLEGALGHWYRSHPHELLVMDIAVWADPGDPSGLESLDDVAVH